MNVVVRHRTMTIEDFLAWEARQEIKFEFDGYEPVAMSGGSFNHSAIQRNLAISVGFRLRGTRRAFHGSDLKLLTGTQSRYPDGQVLCGPMSGHATFATSPVVVFEVVSPSSDSIDRTDKLREYRRVPSVGCYVILEQDRLAATVFVRDGEDWLTHELGSTDLLQLRELGLEFPLEELYEGVQLPATPSSVWSAAAAQQTETGEADPE